jgi:hypothetical protein
VSADPADDQSIRSTRPAPKRGRRQKRDDLWLEALARCFPGKTGKELYKVYRGIKPDAPLALRTVQNRLAKIGQRRAGATDPPLAPHIQEMLGLVSFVRGYTPPGRRVRLNHELAARGKQRCNEVYRPRAS